jgi:hypothetical protein
MFRGVSRLLSCVRWSCVGWSSYKLISIIEKFNKYGYTNSWIAEDVPYKLVRECGKLIRIITSFHLQSVGELLPLGSQQKYPPHLSPHCHQE